MRYAFALHRVVSNSVSTPHTITLLFIASTVNRIRAIVRLVINPMVILEKRTFDPLKPYLISFIINNFSLGEVPQGSVYGRLLFLVSKISHLLRCLLSNRPLE